MAPPNAPPNQTMQHDLTKQNNATHEVSTNASICIVVCYMGQCPPWISLFFKSCAGNPDIDFLIFTDCIPADQAPPNVSIVQTTLEEIAYRATHIVGLQVSLAKPYKLCDFKVAYGEIFREY